MGDISVREYIRWVPEEPSEPTSTIVLTTPKRLFVDLRVLKPTVQKHGDDAGDVTLPLSRLDWAIAGTSSSALVPSRGDPGQQIRHGKWAHWINSRTPDCDEIVDEGDMVDVPSDPSLTLETGRMLNPATGVETDYEEMWRSEPIDKVFEGGLTCLALRMENNNDAGKVRRGLLVRLGQYCQAFARDGDSITIERLKWDAEQQRWVTQIRIGDQPLPTEVATYFAHETTLDDEVKVGDTVWKVVEKA
ncbi:hypothetical protein VTI28DRAFT_10058 [Corynascus sepedonium]